MAGSRVIQLRVTLHPLAPSPVTIHAPQLGVRLIEQSGWVGIAKRFKRGRALVGQLVQAARQCGEVGGFAGRRLARQQASANHQCGKDLPQLMDRARLCSIQHLLADLPMAHSIPKRRAAA